MAAPGWSFVLLRDDDSGKKVSNVKVVRTKSDGTDEDIYLQAVVLVDQRGEPVPINDLIASQHELTTAITELRDLLRLMLG